MTPSELHKKCQSKLPPPHLYVIGVCVCVRVYARMCTSTYACAGQRTTLGIVPRCHSPCCLRQGLSLGLVSADVLDWLADNPQGSTQGYNPPQNWVFQHVASRLASRVIAGDQIPCSLGKRLNTLVISAQPTLRFLNLYSGLTFQGHTELFSNVPKIFPKPVSVTCPQITVKRVVSSNPPCDPFRTLPPLQLTRESLGFTITT